MLAVERGLENITTEEIAASAGVSTRTFFNYYTNKESAAVGTPPAFGQDDKDALRAGTGPLAEDLKRFLDRHFERLEEDEPILSMVGTILRSNEKAQVILNGFLIAERDALAECLSHRVKNRPTAAALASTAAIAIGRTIHLWEHEDDLSLREALDIVWDGLMEAARLLAAPPTP
ncbi:TetR/AcrR family transcriptional regulator [Falsirhodobacter algicola]|uniref:TetR/AcrR family transcriptional regulator n=1 Tax=Falsirhodobacter algicola TaxID=2692330 RepID=UPI001BADDB37|nr:TetR/AcrR family transcriptional regulator [Falsirhodobacter algicola]